MNSTELTGRGAVRCVLAALAAVVVAGAPAAAQGPLALGIDTTAFDHSVRPQDDFFAFVNGGWLARTEIPADRAVWGTFNELGELSENAIREILEEAAAARNPQRGSDVQKLGDFYASFLDTARIERLGMRPLQPELRAIRALRSRAEFPAFLSGMAGRGLGGPFGMGVSQDAKASDQYAIYLSQAGLGLPDRDFYFNDGERFETIRSAYVAYLETLLREAGEADPAGAAQAVMALETQIAEHHWDRTRNRDRDATYNRMTLAELQAAAPGFDWAAYFGGVGLQGVDAVVVRQPSYLPAMDALMGSTPIETWRAYYTVRLVDAAAPYLPRAVGDAQFEFRGRTLQGLEEQRDRARRGVQVVQGGLGEVLGKMYVERHFRPEAKARMEALVGNLLEAFRQGIDDLEWMSPATKAEAHDKLAKFTPRVGYTGALARLRRRSDPPRRPAGQRPQRAGYAAFRRMIDRWGTPVERGEWGMTPQTVNAYYSSDEQRDRFPGGHPPAPLLRPLGRRRGQLRRHRRRDRPRDQPRVRRPGPQAPTATATCATGGPRRTPPPSGARRGAGGAVRRLRAPAGAPERERAPGARREHRRPERAGGGVPRLPAVPGGQEAPVIGGLHRRPALLHGLGAGVAHQVPRRGAAPAAHHRPALAGDVPHQRHPGEHARLLRGVRRAEGDGMYRPAETRVKIW
jgi:putative endopeptidase